LAKERTYLSWEFQNRRTNTSLKLRRIGSLLLLSGIILVLLTVRVEPEIPREEIHQISAKFTLTITFRKERAYNFWWYSVLQDDEGLRRQISTQLFQDVRKQHPRALIHNITIQGNDDAIETRIYPYSNSARFERRIHLKGHSITLSFQISNMLLASKNGLVNVTIPLRGVRLEAKTPIAASAYYEYLMCPNYVDDEVEVDIGEIFNFQAFDRPLHSRFWKRKDDRLRRYVRQKCGIWGIVFKQMTISCSNESTGSSTLYHVGWKTVSFRSTTRVPKRTLLASRQKYLVLSLLGILSIVTSEDRRKRKDLIFVIVFTMILSVAYIPNLLDFLTDSNRPIYKNEQTSIRNENSTETEQTFNQAFAIERTPIIIDAITRPKPNACTTPKVSREVNITHPFTTEIQETETIPLFQESPSFHPDCEGGIDPEGMNFLCVAELTYTQTLEHRQINSNSMIPRLPTGYSIVNGKTWVRANGLTARSNTVLSENFDNGWTTEPPWNIVNDFGNSRLQCRIPSALTSAEYWSYKDLAIPYYDPDTIESISLIFDEYRRKADPGIVEIITGTSWSPYTEQPQCGSRGIDISLNSPHSGSFRFAWTCQSFETHSGGIAYPINHRVSSGDTVQASWSLTRTNEARFANYGHGANNWPMGCGAVLVIVDESGNEKNIILGQKNQDPRWGDSLGGTLGYGGSAQDIDVNEIFQSSYQRSLDGCTILFFYLYGWVEHCAWDGTGDYAYLDVSFNDVYLEVEREANAMESIDIRSTTESGSLASLVVHDSIDPADPSWDLGRSMDIPRETWSDILGKTVRIGVGIEYSGGDIDLLFDNLAVRITFSKAKFEYSEGSLIVADQELHQIPGFEGGEITCSGADFIVEFRCLVSRKLSTDKHDMILYTDRAVSHSIGLTIGYPSSPNAEISYSEYNATTTLPNSYSKIRTVDPAGIDITEYSHSLEYNSTHFQLLLDSEGFESSRYGTYWIMTESPNQVGRLDYDTKSWNRTDFRWESRDGEDVSDGEWTLYVYDPNGVEIFTQSERVLNTTTFATGGGLTIGEGFKPGTYQAVLAWHNGTDGGGAETRFEVCLIRLSCKDLDDNPLLEAVVQLFEDAEIMKETSTDGKGEVALNAFPGRYNINVRIDETIVGEGEINLLTGEISKSIRCSVCHPELRILDGNGRPIVGAETSLISPAGSSSTLLTDGYGKARFNNIVTGNYSTSVIWRGKEVGNITFTLQYSATIAVVCDVHTLTVSICDIEGIPLPYSTLIVDFPNGTERTVTADSNGKVELEQVAGGTHRLRTYWKGEQVADEIVHLSNSNPVLLYTTVESSGGRTGNSTFLSSSWSGGGGGSGGGGASEEVTEERYVFCSLTVEVVTRNGEKVQGVEVKVIDAETGRLTSVMTTGVDGTAKTLVTTGTYELEAHKDENIARKVVTLESDRMVRIVLELKEEAVEEETPLTIISAAIAILGSALYLFYRRRLGR
jgi:hypothetical protein